MREWRWVGVNECVYGFEWVLMSVWMGGCGWRWVGVNECVGDGRECQ